MNMLWALVGSKFVSAIFTVFGSEGESGKRALRWPPFVHFQCRDDALDARPQPLGRTYFFDVNCGLFRTGVVDGCMYVSDFGGGVASADRVN